MHCCRALTFASARLSCCRFLKCLYIFDIGFYYEIFIFAYMSDSLLINVLIVYNLQKMKQAGLQTMKEARSKFRR